MTLWDRFFLAFWRSCWQAFFEMRLMRQMAEREAPTDAKAPLVLGRFRDLVRGVREAERDPGPEPPAPTG